MRILLDAYFDNNFGDDLFADTLLTRYPQEQFYVFWDKAHPDVLARTMRYRNMVVLPGNCAIRSGLPFDGYIMIGGDVLPDGVDYSRRIGGMKWVKESGGFVAMLGFSLYEHYGEKTRGDLRTMALLADSIVTRDKASAERFKMLVPEASVTESTDMAFTLSHMAAEEKRAPILGIAPRRKLYSTDQEHEDFCSAMAAVADGWLKGHPDGIVRFLALSTGEYDDRVTSRDIIDRMTKKTQTEIVSHTDQVEEFLAQVRQCTALVPTRFHALVFALIYGIPFVPVPYEVKLTQLLDEIGYAGMRIPYGRPVSEEMAAQAVRELEQRQTDPEKVAGYCAKADVFFSDTDRLIAAIQPCRAENLHSFGCSMQSENEALKTENAQLTRDREYLQNQVKALTEWVQSLQKERQAFEDQNRELEAIRVQQAEQIEKLSRRSPLAKLLGK